MHTHAVERPAREATFAALVEDLVEQRHSDTALRYRFQPRTGTEQRLRDLTTQEEACCAFLRFTIRADDELWWEIDAPDPETRSALQELFTPLVPMNADARQNRQ